MMNFHLGQGPYIKSKNTTSKIMLHVLIALLPIIIFAFIKNGIIPYNKGYISFSEMFRPLILIFTGAISSLIFESLYTRLVLKKKNNEFKKYLKSTYSIFPGLFLSLVLPINTPILLIVFGAFMATVIGKMLFGGFGYNIFNPALIGVLFVTVMYGGLIANNGGYVNKMELDTMGSATPLSRNIEGIGSYEELVKNSSKKCEFFCISDSFEKTEKGSLTQLFLGNKSGSLGEVSGLLILIAFLYLTAVKVIKWRIPVIYVGTVFITSSIIGSINGLTLWYPLYQILTGGLLFGAVFMATDPVTSPTTPIGQIIYGLFLGILTVTFRYLTPYPEGVMTAILSMNMLVFIIDRIGAKSRFNFKHSFILFLLAWFSITGLGYTIGKSFKVESVDKTFNIISKTKTGNKTEYIATQRGFISDIKAKVVLESGKIVEYEVLEQNESYYQRIVEEKYLEKLIKEDFNKVDTIAGATKTSSALKDLLKKVMIDYEK